MRPLPGLRSLLVGTSTAVVVLALVILPFLTPAWVGFEQGRAQSAAWTGFAPADLRAATDRILTDLIVGPPDFDVAVGGVPVLKAAERAHMRDVRSVFAAFYLIAGVALVILAVGWRSTRGASVTGRTRYLRTVRGGATGLAIALVAAGIVAAVAFDAAFEVFHRLFFPAGTYNFDPATDRLVQLFPDVFWSETTMVVGGVALAGAIAVVVLTGRALRARGALDAPGVGARGTAMGSRADDDAESRRSGSVAAGESGPNR